MSKTILLNNKYRKILLGGARASSTDCPLVKTLLFLLTERDLDVERLNSVRKRRLDRLSALLAEVVLPTIP